MKKNIKRLFLFLSIVVILLAASCGGYLYYISTKKLGIDKPIYITIDERKHYDDVLTQLGNVAKAQNIAYFDHIAFLKQYPKNVKRGRYEIKPEDDVWTIVDKLNKGIQSPVKLTFNNIRLKKDLTERLSEQLMFSDEELTAALGDSAKCALYGFTPQTVVAMFIPNTYEIYWDTSVDKFMGRMKKEYDSFWNSNRRAKAEQLNMTPLEVSTLASIVEEECTFSDEYTIVAGLYINRLKRGQLLQADPTVKYAIGDFTLQRILFKHLEIDSPYNTYIYSGLPPSPIRIPSIKGLDAVLNYKEHKYLYMCAKEDFSGRHNFAVTHAEHNRNAERYRSALNRRRIY